MLRWKCAMKPVVAMKKTCEDKSRAATADVRKTYFHILLSNPNGTGGWTFSFANAGWCGLSR
jgi:hypothetical protein